jgi:hypothetical protein
MTNRKAVIITLGFMWAMATGNLINAYNIINSSPVSAFSYIIIFYLLPVLVIVRFDKSEQTQKGKETGR